MSRQVLSIGQCAVDHSAITQFLQARFDVQVTPAESAVDGLDLLRKRPYDLVLINRQLDCDGSEGVAVLRLIKGDHTLSQTPVILVTNYAEHQQNAVMQGAIYGFGKNDLGMSSVVERLQPYLG